MKNYLLFILSVITTALLAQSGSLDPSFGNGGIVIAPSPLNTNEMPQAIAIQPDGKIIVGCNSYYGECILVRFNTDGSIDSSFSGDGRFYIQADTAIYLHRLTILSTGKILYTAARSPFSYYDNKMRTYRLNPDGTPDLTYGTNGKGELLYPDKSFNAKSTILLPGDTIVCGGDAMYVGDINKNVCAFKFNPDGTPCSSFGNNGIVEVDANTNYDIFSSMVCLADGSIVLIGNSDSNVPDNEDTIHIIKLKPNGSFDNTFGTNGIAYINFNNLLVENIIDIDKTPDGKLICAGMYNVVPYIPFIFRVNANGTVDNTFGTNSIATVNTPYPNELTQKVLCQPDGKILLYGYAGPNMGNTYTESIWVARFKSNGEPDSTFGTNGLVLTDVSNIFEYATNFALQPDGKIVACGYIEDTLVYQDKLFLVRYENNIETGVNEAPIYKANLVYPNPANNYIELDKRYFSANQTDKLSIIDLNGKLIKDFDPTKEGLRLNLADIANGQYIVQYNTGSKTYYSKLIVAH